MDTNTMYNMLDHADFVVILSAELASRGTKKFPNYATTLNRIATQELKQELQSTGLHFMQVEGCYKGDSEVAFAVQCRNVFDVMRISCMGIHTFEQESILIVDVNNCQVMLKYATHVEPIGASLRQVDSCAGLGAYTKINDEIWAVAYDS